LPGVQRFRDGMLRTARQGSYEQIMTMMFGRNGCTTSGADGRANIARAMLTSALGGNAR
jgi:hypothetical protein